MGTAGRKKGNIQKKVITSIILVGIIPGLLVVILTYLTGINALKSSIGANFQEIAKETADKIQLIMDRETKDAQTLALSPSIRAEVLKANKRYLGKIYSTTQNDMNEILIQLNSAQDDVLDNKFLNNNLSAYLKEYQKDGTGEHLSILVTDRKGVTISATNKTAPSQSGKVWWRTTFNDGKGKVFISGIDIEEDREDYSMAIAVPIMDDANKTSIGVLKMVYDVKNIFKTITNINIGETGHANLVTSDGILVVCPIFPPKSHKVNEELIRQISSNKPGWGVAADDAHGGENSIIGFAPVTSTLQLALGNFGGKAWYIFVRQLPKETYAPMYALLWKVSFLGLAFIALLFPLGFYAARRIVGPIYLLTEGAELIGKGHLSHRIGIKTNDEIEQLAETFNQMADNLEKSGMERENYLRQLKESEEHYKSLFDHAEDSMFMVNTEGRIIAINQRQEEILGYYNDNILGREFSLILPEKEKKTFADLFQLALNGEKPPTNEVEVLTHGQDLLTMEMDLTGIKRGDKIAFVQTHLRNITKRKILEKEILLERDRLKTVLESMGDGWHIVDKSFKIQFMDKNFLKSFSREAIGKRCYEIYLGRTMPCDGCPVVKGAEKPGVVEINTITGQTFLVTPSVFRNLDGTVSILEIFKDVTEKKKLERTVKDSEEQYKSLFDYAEDSMLMVNIEGRVIAVNKREEDVIGYHNDAIVAHLFSSILPDDYKKVFSELFEQAIKDMKPPTAEVEVLTLGQDLLTMEMDITAIKKGGAMVFVLIHLRDITERKVLEHQLLMTERLNALSHFSSTLAHDLRNPIIGIKKTLESLQNTIEVTPPATIKRVLDDLVSSSKLLLGMINDVLDVYQDSYKELPLIMSTFPLVEAIEEAVKLLQIEAEDKKVNVNLQLDSKHKLISIHGDKRRLQRVFINLLDNAIKYSDIGGKVEITFKPDSEEGAHYVLFKIEDEGMGIPPSNLLNIFDPLYIKGEKRDSLAGTGLGLYFCKVVVGAHDGNIWAENRKGKGAVFYIKMPIGIRDDAY